MHKILKIRTENLIDYIRLLLVVMKVITLYHLSASCTKMLTKWISSEEKENYNKNKRVSFWLSPDGSNISLYFALGPQRKINENILNREGMMQFASNFSFLLSQKAMFVSSASALYLYAHSTTDQQGAQENHL